MENWKAIPGYEGLYEASDLGNIRSLDRIVPNINRWKTVTHRLHKGRILAGCVQEPSPGYFRQTLALSKEGRAVTKVVSHLIAAAFIGPRPLGWEVAHCDGNSMNNAAVNLRYDTPLRNTHDKFAHGTMLRGASIRTSKLTEEQAKAIIALRGKERLLDVANRYGVRESAISRIQTGKRWKHLHAPD